ncbi:hypothetical protein C8R44DRAFT_799085 [Mycena epipterygia]|nr:hypothetical protein C8R44DRAFT_799085 [Mycena epipterygia]
MTSLLHERKYMPHAAPTASFNPTTTSPPLTVGLCRHRYCCRLRRRRRCIVSAVLCLPRIYKQRLTSLPSAPRKLLFFRSRRPCRLAKVVGMEDTRRHASNDRVVQCPRTNVDHHGLYSPPPLAQSCTSHGRHAEGQLPVEKKQSVN